MPKRICLSGVLAFTTTCALATDAAPKAERQPQSLAAMTLENAASRITVKDDDLEVDATITTQNVWEQRTLTRDQIRSDLLFRAYVDKKTGKVRYQVYHVAARYALDWLDFRQVNFETPLGPASKKVLKVDRDKGSCGRSKRCERVEHSLFIVEEELLRTLASQYEPETLKMWRFRLKGKGGDERNEGFSLAEIAALLEVVDAYKASHGLDSAPVQRTKEKA